MTGPDLSPPALPRIGVTVAWQDGARERRGEVVTYHLQGSRIVVTVRDPEDPEHLVTLVTGPDGVLAAPPATAAEAQAVAAAVLSGQRLPLGVEAQLTLLASAVLTRDAS